MTKVVDSYRFIGGMTKRLVKSWIGMEPPRSIPWAPLPRPVSECRVALISSGGIALKSDRPFDREGERQNPWWGDPSYRVIPRTAETADIRVYHLHIDPAFAEQDLNCLLPIHRLAELAETGEVGDSALSHYSLMGYILQPEEMLEKSVPAMTEQMQAEEVDLAVLIPA